jgi:protein-S-isoprenylcysteine O-methyltransferase Ste14
VPDVNPIVRRIVVSVILVSAFVAFVYLAMIVKTPYAIIVPAVCLVLFGIDVWLAKRRRLKRRLARRERAQQKLSTTPPVSYDP